jgi:hypothetical protein
MACIRNVCGGDVSMMISRQHAAAEALANFLFDADEERKQWFLGLALEHLSGLRNGSMAERSAAAAPHHPPARTRSR